MTMKRKRLTVDEKMKILGAHIDKVKISDTCREFDIHPNQFLQWKKTILEAGALSLNGKNRAGQREQERLKQKLAKKDEIISSLAEENLALKK